ncbi:hypothetical protein [Spartinivicinus poritis]|uniref:Glycosyltransferase RgtA/B/C/D-like domain-containing protein n=1 Tax=Spartinivicinus poritis TaxID=2994640 RepID=A0ABT5U9F2_9GAMM|nr:hypothetical protein [Spartinivicinus sp. A2-2]MDE1462810.1 hypothetical protein [Spartinivicinus sp. A2-2]
MFGVNSPDSAAYLYLGESIIYDGKLFIEGWEHIDIGLILPPVFPFLIGVGNFFMDPVLFASFINTFCISCAVILLMAYVVEISSTENSLIFCLIVQLNWVFAYFGSSILTEGVFIFILSVNFILALKVIERGRGSIAFILGLTSATLFLTRHIGIFFFIVFLGYLILYNFQKKIIIYLLVGFNTIFIPYSIALYEQTGEVLTSQRFRLNKYVVKTSKKKDIKIISSYSELIENRRRLRKLLVDSSEMEGYTISIDTKKSGFRVDDYAVNLYKNIIYILDLNGNLFFVCFILSIISSFSLKINNFFDECRKILSLCIIFYFIFVSFFSGLIGRYVYVIFPFAVVVVVCEFYYIFRYFNLKINTFLCWFFCLGLILLFSLNNAFFEVKMTRKSAKESDPLFLCKKIINKNDPIFSFHPGHAYILGGVFRVIPNDSLEKVIKYAKKTGVKWLVIDESNNMYYEESLYKNIDWIKSKKIDFYKAINKRCIVKLKGGENLISVYEVK